MNKLKALGVILITFIFISATLIKVELEKKSLLKGRIEIKIPKDFKVMNDEMLKLKYPSEKRPTHAFTNESGGINVAFSISNSQVDQNSIEPLKEVFEQTFKKLYPSADWKGSGVENINGRKVGYIELVTPAVDTEIYNLIFFTDFDGSLLLCTFNCTKEDIEDWTPYAKEIMNSLKINPEKK